jgi:hypothetical protein
LLLLASYSATQHKQSLYSRGRLGKRIAGKDEVKKNTTWRRALLRELPHRAECAEREEDCSSGKCCKDDKLVCFRKNTSWSGCRLSCSPGADMDNPATNAEPWACVEDDELEPVEDDDPELVEDDEPEPELQCSKPHEDCSQTRCCTEPGALCYEKAPSLWATCLQSCKAGIHEEDPPDHRGPWSCRLLDGKSDAGGVVDAGRANASGTIHPSGDVASEAEDGVGFQVQMGSNFSKVFCFAVTRAEGDEFALMLHQFHAGIGIFACDSHVVFSSQATELPDTQVLSNFFAAHEVADALTATWVNADVFADVWAWILSKGRAGSHDWFVKVDPDAVFVPDHLKLHLASDRFGRAARAENGAYLKNCDAEGLQVYGAIEVLSRNAVQKMGREIENCRNLPDHDRMGEDMWLQRCLDLVGAMPIEDYEDLVKDKYCPGSGDFNDCSFQVVAFHPFKLPDQWSACYRQATQQSDVIW